MKAPLALGESRDYPTNVGTYRLGHVGPGQWELHFGAERMGFWPRQLAAENAIATDARSRWAMTFGSGRKDGADDRRMGLSCSPMYKLTEAPDYVRGYHQGYEEASR